MAFIVFSPYYYECAFVSIVVYECENRQPKVSLRLSIQSIHSLFQSSFGLFQFDLLG